MSTFQISHALKLRRPTAPPPPSEFEGTVEEGGGKLAVYNAEAFVELMQSCDWTPNDGTDPKVPRGPRMVTRPAGCHGNAAVLGFTQMEEEFKKREQEAFEDKQRMRESAFQSKLDAAKEDMARRQREREAARERDFARRLEEFQQRSAQIISESGKLVKENESLKEKKRERLFTEWTNKVFEPEQRQIQGYLNSTDAKEITQRRAKMFDRYLEATNKKKCGVFRDIIIESQYDPVGDMKRSTLKIKKVPARDDPTLTRPLREEADPVLQRVQRQARSTLNSGDASDDFTKKKKKKTDVSVLQWASIGDTTYGRYSENNKSQSSEALAAKMKHRPKDHIRIDHYDYPKGSDGLATLRDEGYNYRKSTRAQQSATTLTLS